MYDKADELVVFRLMPMEPQFQKFEASWSFHVIDYDRRVVAFRDETTGKVNSWHWDFGDGTTSAEQHPIHQYREGKDYTVVLKVEAGRQIAPPKKSGCRGEIAASGASSPARKTEDTDGTVSRTVVTGCPLVSSAVNSAGRCSPLCGSQMRNFLLPRSTTLVSIALGEELAKK
jgi:hypothetical protein